MSLSPAPTGKIGGKRVCTEVAGFAEMTVQKSQKHDGQNFFHKNEKSFCGSAQTSMAPFVAFQKTNLRDSETTFCAPTVT